MSNSIPPIPFIRNSFGLLEHIDYKFNDDGSVNWRALIDPQYIVPNKRNTNETDPSKLEDKDLLILFEGFNKLARLRGFLSVEPESIVSTPEFASVRTTILWTPNFETDNVAVLSGGMANAHSGNTTTEFQGFLTSIAENRAFVRAVRKFLGIPIVGNDEMDDAVKTATTATTAKGTESHVVLEELLRVNNIKFESFKNKMQGLGIAEAQEWQSCASIPSSRVFEMIGHVQTALAQRAAKKQSTGQD